MSEEQARAQELLVDGVRVFHRPGPAKTRAVLFFAVGLQDETFETVGLTHLVEHLTMAQQPKSYLDANATVTVDHTAFFAYGRPEEVGAFLHRVCTALADLPLDHLERERNVVLTEGTAGADPTMAAAWAARYGFDGPGLATTDGHGPLVLTGEEVLAHTAEHFTAGRAALAVLGPLPEGLSLPLRPSAPGAAPSAAPAAASSRRRPQPRLGDGPEWVEAPSPGVGLLLDGLAPYDGATRLAGTVLAQRLEEVARTRRGLTYSVASDVMDGPDGDVLTLALDFREGRAGEVAALVWEQLTDLATHGPAQAELDHARAGYVAELDPTDTDVLEEEPFRYALGAAFGDRVRSLEEIAASLDGVSTDDVRDRLAVAAGRALLVLPEEARLPESASRSAPIAERSWCAVAPVLPPGRQLRPPLLDRLRYQVARRRLVLTDESMAMQDEAGAVHVVRWDEVAGVTALPYADGGVAVLGRDLCGLPVHPDAYGRAAYEEVLRRLAPHVERLRQCERAQEEAQRAAGEPSGEHSGGQSGGHAGEPDPAVAGRR